MGTRGFITFAVGGTEKTAYNHFDSYPTGVGTQVVEALKTEWVTPDAVRELRVVGPDDKPTPADVRKLAAFTDLGVSRGSTDDWYCLLRETQGDPVKILRAGVIEDAGDFPLDSLFAKWGYVIDMDTMKLEIYAGFQKQPHDKGRFAHREVTDDYAREHGYHPVALVASYDILGGLPDDAELERLERSVYGTEESIEASGR